jgi:hypothetical protein
MRKFCSISDTEISRPHRHKVRNSSPEMRLAIQTPDPGLKQVRDSESAWESPSYACNGRTQYCVQFWQVVAVELQIATNVSSAMS